jgi:hypothetical protein
MSQADQAQYASSVTRLSENELQDVLRAAESPVCLLGGWAVHPHVTDGFRSAHGRDYIGSRDIDIGIHVDPAWTAEDITESSVPETLSRIENDLGYSRGRFGFYQQFHRETGDSLTEEHARELAAHNVFRVDIDIIPDTTELDAFDSAFGFQPPAEPLLEPIFTEGTGDSLGDIVDWDVPDEITIAPPAALAAMKIRAFPDRDKSHKRLKDLADLHALLWYVADYDTLRPTVQQQITDDDVTAFASTVTDQLYERTARLIDVDSTIVRQSIEQLFV